MSMSDAVDLSRDEATDLCIGAAMRAGASAATARSLARASVAAETEGKPNIGLAHFVDYLNAIESGRIDGRAVPSISCPAPAMIHSDARAGAAHPGFDMAFERLVAMAREIGVALFAQRNSYTCGALGYFTERLAGEGLAALAATNGPALMAGAGGTAPVFCTNPLAFSVPVASGRPLTIDQASSATAFVNIRRAAAEARSIPEGWAVDESGRPTTDPQAAMKGALLAFGGTRGANIALMVEVLAAGLTGANWSVDAPSFMSGNESPGTGMLVLAIQPSFLDPDFATRAAAYLDRLHGEFGIYIPGRTKAETAPPALLSIPRALHERLAR